MEKNNKSKYTLYEIKYKNEFGKVTPEFVIVNLNIINIHDFIKFYKNKYKKFIKSFDSEIEGKKCFENQIKIFESDTENKYNYYQFNKTNNNDFLHICLDTKIDRECKLKINPYVLFEEDAIIFHTGNMSNLKTILL